VNGVDEMTGQIILKTFKTYRNHYVYGRHTNSLVLLGEDEYCELSLVEKGDLPAEQSQVIKRYQESGDRKSVV
jgi:hypothetical protein